jgi:hypothetical protein
MIDTQQQYIKLNIRGEISIIVVQSHSAGKEIYAHKRTTLTHIYRIEYNIFYCLIIGPT